MIEYEGMGADSPNINNNDRLWNIEKILFVKSLSRSIESRKNIDNRSGSFDETTY